MSDDDGQGTVCQLCGRAEGHSPRCSVTKFGAPDMRMPASMEHPRSGEAPTCEATTRTGQPCGKRARFVYQVVAGKREYLCGQHVGPFGRDSRYLREIR